MYSVSCEDKSVSPNKIVCIGRNYVEHIEELGNEVPEEAVIFFKPNSSIGEELIEPEGEACQFEGELCFLYKDNKLAYVAFGLDLTKREVQNKLKAQKLPWERAKAFKNSALFSRFVSFEKVENLSLELHVNNKLVQKGDVSMMLFQPKEIIVQILSFSNLDENDIIMSGTPSGVGEFKKGDILAGRVLEDGKLLVEKEWKAI